MSTTLITNAALLNLGRIGFRAMVFAEIQKSDSPYKRIANIIDTKQLFERFQLLSDFGRPQPTDDVAPGYFDSRIALATRDYTPKEYTLGFAITRLADYTDQYNVLKRYRADVAKAFMENRDFQFAQLFNNGFSSSYPVIDGSAFFSTSHSYGPYPTWSNRPATDISLSYVGMQQAIAERRRQKTARQKPLGWSNKVRLIVPPELEMASAELTSKTRPDTADRSDSSIAGRFEPMVVDHLTSTTAWFLIPESKDDHGIHLIEQMPFAVFSSPDAKGRSADFMCSESYVFCVTKAQGTWGTSGA